MCLDSCSLKLVVLCDPRVSSLDSRVETRYCVPRPAFASRLARRDWSVVFPDSHSIANSRLVLRDACANSKERQGGGRGASRPVKPYYTCTIQIPPRETRRIIPSQQRTPHKAHDLGLRPVNANHARTRTRTQARFQAPELVHNGCCESPTPRLPVAPWPVARTHEATNTAHRSATGRIASRALPNTH